MRLPVLYRAAGATTWHEGVTTNLSAAGVLIEGHTPSPGGAPIAVLIPLPSSDGCLTGCGRLVSASRAGRDRFAIVVSHYRLQRQSAAIAQLDTLHQEC